MGGRPRRPVARVVWRIGWPVRAALLAAIRSYRVTFAGMLGGQCRFHPSCSLYAEQAIRNAGASRGVALSFWRVLRCSPLTKGGVDFPPGTGGRYDDAIHAASARGAA